MKSLKIIIYFIILIPALNIQAQSKFSFGIISSFLLNNRVITSSGLNVSTDYLDPKGKNKDGFGILGSVQYRMSDWVSIGSGFGYSVIGYQTEKKVVSIYGRIRPDAPTYSYVFEYSNIDIPIHLVYHSTGKLSFNAVIGPSIDFQTPKHFNAVFHNSSSSQNAQALGDLLLHEAKSANRKINVSLDLGVGLGYKLTENFELVLRPKFSYFLLSNETPGLPLYVQHPSTAMNLNEPTKENFYSMGLSLKILFTP